MTHPNAEYDPVQSITVRRVRHCAKRDLVQINTKSDTMCVRAPTRVGKVRDSSSFQSLSTKNYLGNELE